MVLIPKSFSQLRHQEMNGVSQRNSRRMVINDRKPRLSYLIQAAIIEFHRAGGLKTGTYLPYFCRVGVKDQDSNTVKF